MINTVTISLEEYNSLVRETKKLKEIIEKKAMAMAHKNYPFDNFYIVNETDLIRNMDREISKLNEIVELLEKKNNLNPSEGFTHWVEQVFNKGLSKLNNK